MKRSKLYLTATVAILAVAGAAASHVNRQPNSTVFYQAGFRCLPMLSHQTHCVLGASLVTCYYVTTSAPLPLPHMRLTLYTQNWAGAFCSNIATYGID